MLSLLINIARCLDYLQPHYHKTEHVSIYEWRLWSTYSGIYIKPQYYDTIDHYWRLPTHLKPEQNGDGKIDQPSHLPQQKQMHWWMKLRFSLIGPYWQWTIIRLWRKRFGGRIINHLFFFVVLVWGRILFPLFLRVCGKVYTVKLFIDLEPQMKTFL